MSLVRGFGEAVRTHRKRLQMTQEQLAELADLHVNHISFIERGLKAPTLAAVEALAAALKVRASALIRAAENQGQTDVDESVS